MSRHCDTRGRGFSLGRTPYIRDFICQCALPNASPKQKHSREVCIKIKKAASLDSCAVPAIWVMERCRKLSPFSLLRNTNVEEMQGPLLESKGTKRTTNPSDTPGSLVHHILILICIKLCITATTDFKCLSFFFIVACI